MAGADPENGRATARVRMEAIATLPVFFKLAGRRAVLAGGTAPAAWKAELLSAAGASVDVYAANSCAEIIALAAQPPGGPIRLVPRDWTPDDLAGAAIAIGDIEEAQAATFRDAARRHGVPVNVIDKPPYCDFQFGTVVSRSPLVIGISTDGAAPVFGQAIRARIEALLPQGMTGWARAAQDWRKVVQRRQPSFRARRRFWERFSELALQSPHDLPTQDDFDRCLTDMSDDENRPEAALGLIGSGSGDPDSITLLAIRRLQASDVIVHDPDVHPAIIGLARRESLKIPLPWAEPKDAAAEVSLWLGQGRIVSWLGRGNPRICAQWAKRKEALSAFAAAIDHVEGLGTCARCGTDCPAFSQTQSDPLSGLAQTLL